MNDSNNIEPVKKDAALLLERFLSGQDREVAFGRLVESYGGLVYSSALRRTNDPQLAEEVAQNVFAIIARKAASLQKHPALMAWIFKTTRFEASKAMRAERRRRQKHDALAREPADVMKATTEADDEAAWRAAVPLLDESLDDLSEKDRQIVLQRFFEERKFKEIALASGRSEAACKMQLKRALGKLSKLLTQRGVALSATVIASGLASELTHAASAKALAAIAPKVLAASGQVGAVSMITVQTMSTIKTVSITTAAVIAVASAPFLWQKSNAKGLEDGLADLESQRLALAGQVEALSGIADPREVGVAVVAVRTARDLLRASDEPIDADAFLNLMMEAMMSGDIVGMIRVLLPISNLESEEYEALVKAVEEHQGHGEMKIMVMEMIESFAPSDNLQKSLERVMKFGLEPHSYSDLLAQWGSQDPDAALEWYLKGESEGAFLSKGVSDHNEGMLIAELVGGIAAKDPQRALDLFREYRESDKHNRMLSTLGHSFGRLIRAGGDDALLREFIGAARPSSDSAQKVEIVNAATIAAVASGDLDAQLAFASNYLEDPAALSRVVVNLVRNVSSGSLAERGDWLVENTPPDLQVEAVGELISRVASQDSETTSKWVLEQSGAIRDSGLRAIADWHLRYSQHQLAFEHADQIADEGNKNEVLQRLAVQWLRSNPEEASAALPAELVDKHQPVPQVTTPGEVRSLENSRTNS